MYPQWKSFIDHSFPYITGNGFAVQCKHIWNYDGYKVNPHNKPDNFVFIKTDYIADYFSRCPVPEKAVIFTHNSDYPITEGYLKYLDDSRVAHWFAQNVAISHPKLHAVPIGIANAGYAHGDTSVITRIREEHNKKDNLFYANYSIQNNRAEREKCLKLTGVPMVTDTGDGWNGFAGQYHLANTFEGYLRDLSRSYFCISPKGNGIDCHRTWEALYMGAIPIVTKSEIVSQHSDYPIVILNDWEEFDKKLFTPEFYASVWDNFNIGDIHMDNYMKRIMSTIDKAQ